jgi:hypothetical protein
MISLMGFEGQAASCAVARPIQDVAAVAMTLAATRCSKVRREAGGDWRCFMACFSFEMNGMEGAERCVFLVQDFLPELQEKILASL